MSTYRGFKLVGPFVVMIYKMIRTDLIRFFTIYLIFVVGFSQCKFGVISIYNLISNISILCFILYRSDYALVHNIETPNND